MIPAKNQRLLDYGLLGLAVASLPKSPSRLFKRLCPGENKLEREAVLTTT